MKHVLAYNRSKDISKSNIIKGQKTLQNMCWTFQKTFLFITISSICPHTLHDLSLFDHLGPLIFSFSCCYLFPTSNPSIRSKFHISCFYLFLHEVHRPYYLFSLYNLINVILSSIILTFITYS